MSLVTIYIPEPNREWFFKYKDWIKRYRRDDLKRLTELAKRYCVDSMTDIIKFYYCLAHVVKTNKSISIPFFYELTVVVLEEIRNG